MCLLGKREITRSGRFGALLAHKTKAFVLLTKVAITRPDESNEANNDDPQIAGKTKGFCL